MDVFPYVGKATGVARSREKPALSAAEGPHAGKYGELTPLRQRGGRGAASPLPTGCFADGQGQSKPMSFRLSPSRRVLHSRLSGKSGFAFQASAFRGRAWVYGLFDKLPSTFPSP